MFINNIIKIFLKNCKLYTNNKQNENNINSKKKKDKVKNLSFTVF